MVTVRTLFAADEIALRVDALADAIARELPSELVLVGVLKGCFVFAADLVRALHRRDVALRVEFIRLSSYGLGRESSGEVGLVGRVPDGIAGQPVLLVDDIVDTGHTLAFAAPLLTRLGATRVWTCVLVDKPSRREVAFTPDFTGFEVPDVFIVGYGIDYAERYRERPDIAAID
jgi:hypoxanthine phosphoribosyltransferase